MILFRKRVEVSITFVLFTEFSNQFRNYKFRLYVIFSNCFDFLKISTIINYKQCCSYVSFSQCQMQTRIVFNWINYLFENSSSVSTRGIAEKHFSQLHASGHHFPSLHHKFISLTLRRKNYQIEQNILYSDRVNGKIQN